MLVLFKNIKEENVLVFDAEYNEGSIIQFSGILFKKIEKDVFQISKSLNIYIKLNESEHINRFIKDFTGISDDFLEQNGLELKEAIEKINELIKVDGSIIFVSHGLSNDRQILFDNGINFYGITRNEIAYKSPVYPGICTYKLAKKVLDRQGKLSLTDVAADAGVFLSNSHNAFDDAWATIAVLSLLKKLESEQ